MLTLSPDIRLSSRKIKSILHNTEKSAAAVNLLYVSDSEPGIKRFKKGPKFIYKFRDKTLNNTETLLRIKKLVIPPAWENVWICPLENGHLQVTGSDARRRKQYKYHALWNHLRNHTKFYRLHAFGCVLPAIRQRLEKDLSLPGLPQEKVLALVVSLMQLTSIRIGSNLYEKLYGSFGLTTLKDRHVKIDGAQMQFTFRGKKGISHNISLKSKKLAALVKKCRDIPGKELFQYTDEKGIHKSVDSGMVNNYLKNICGEDFSAKDFRTWSGTVQALCAFKQIGEAETITETKKNIVAVLDVVAKHLGNTRSVCRKYYVHPALINLYEEKNLHRYFSGSVAEADLVIGKGMAEEEKLLLKILENEGLIIK
ncbi:MAG: DNA topoisomerase IB [Bacteroidota bacterium]